MEGIKQYIGNIFCIYIIMSVLESIISNEKYERYMKLLGGVVMIMVVVAPLAGMFSGNEIAFDSDIFSECELSDEVYAGILSAEKGRHDEIINLYCDTVRERAASCVEGTDYELISCEVRLNLDETSSDYGKILLVDIALLKKNGIYPGQNKDFYDFDIVALKNNLANFYNIPQANIYINIYDGQDNKEGIEN